MQLRFENPMIFWALLGVIALAYLMVRQARKTEFSRRRFGIAIGAFTLCIIGLARPQLGQKVTAHQSVRSNLFIAIDISKSMLAQDTSPSRIGFAITFTQKLLQLLSGVKVAVFPFTLDGYLLTPLTTDIAATLDMLSSLNPNFTTNQGTDISQSLETLFQSISKMEKLTHDQGGEWLPTQILLFSDGESHYPLKASTLKLFKSKRIPIFTVGTGTASGALIPNETRFSVQKDFLKDRDGKVIKTQLHPDLLKKISDATGGDYFNSRFEEIHTLHDRLNHSMSLGKLTTAFKIEKEYYPTLFAVALALFLIEFLFGRWEFALRMFFALAVASQIVPNVGRAEGAESEEHYEVQGNADDQTRSVESYNKGVSLLRQNNFLKAAEAFQETILLSKDGELKKKALFNLGNTFLKLTDPLQAIQTYQQAHDFSSGNRSFDTETNQKISDNLVLAQKMYEMLKKQASNQEGQGQGEGNQNQPSGKQEDPNGPRKNYKGQSFSQQQKERIYSLIAQEEQDILQRLQEEKNRNRASRVIEKPW